MSTIASFDAENKIINITQEPDENGIITIDAQDLYSFCKEQWLEDPILNKHIFCFDTEGGAEVGTQVSGRYFYLRTDLGWRIRPFESNHELRVEGLLYPRRAEDSLFTSTLGSFQIVQSLERSSLAIETVRPDEFDHIKNVVVRGLLR